MNRRFCVRSPVSLAKLGAVLFSASGDCYFVLNCSRDPSSAAFPPLCSFHISGGALACLAACSIVVHVEPSPSILRGGVRAPGPFRGAAAHVHIPFAQCPFSKARLVVVEECPISLPLTLSLRLSLSVSPSRFFLPTQRSMRRHTRSFGAWPRDVSPPTRRARRASSGTRRLLGCSWVPRWRPGDSSVSGSPREPRCGEQLTDGFVGAFLLRSIDTRLIQETGGYILISKSMFNRAAKLI